MVSFLTAGHMILPDMCLKLPFYLMHSHIILKPFLPIPTDQLVYELLICLNFPYIVELLSVSDNKDIHA